MAASITRLHMVQCPNCRDEYESLGSHAALSDCPYPELTDSQKEIVKGLMLGDGWINHHNDNGNPFFAVAMVNKEFIEWVNGQLSPLTTGVKDATGGEWSDRPYYKVRTIRSPHFKKYLRWYPESKYELQEVDLTPTILKMWYVSDGTLNDRPGRKPYLQISTHADIDREAYFSSMFEPLGVAVSRDSGKEIGFTVEDTEKLFRYMGDAPPGFDRKWPDEVMNED